MTSVHQDLVRAFNLGYRVYGEWEKSFGMKKIRKCQWRLVEKQSATV